MIQSFGTAVPENSYPQEVLAAALAERLNLKGILAVKQEKIFRHSRIKKRHTIARLDKTPFFPDFSPCTTSRNEIYIEEAPKLAEEAARKAIEKWEGDVSQITDVISISCTGMMAPGIEFLLLDRLGLRRDVNRLGVNFMGCFGGFKGLSLAKALADQGPERRVLLVCTELCSLHFQSDPTLETFVANAIFADGAAAVIIGGEGGWEIVNTASMALEDSLKEMTWESSNQGYRMRLTARVPLYVRQNIRDFFPKIAGDLSVDDCDWAVHPGGKAILHSFRQIFGLSEEDLAASYHVMENYGNMSSASILFVLDALKKKNEWTVGMGFGPGLSVEGVLLRAPQ